MVRYGRPLPPGNYGPTGLPGYVDAQGNFQPRPAGGYRTGVGASSGGGGAGGPSPLQMPAAFQGPGPAGGTFGQDIGQLRNPTRPIPLRQAIPGSRFQFEDAAQDAQVVGGSLTIFDLGMGFNMQKGPLEIAHAHLASGTAYVSHEGQMILPPADEAAATPDPTAGVTPTWMTFLSENFSQLLVAVASDGGVSSVNLFREGTDGLFTALTYEAKILGLWRIVMNGTIYTAVGKAGAATEMLTDYGAGADITPASAGSMNAATSGTVGMMQALELADTPILMKYGTVLASLSGNVAIGTAPTNQMTPLNTGGGAIGFRGIGGRDIYGYWFWPKDSSSTYGNQGPMEIVYTNAFGTGAKRLLLGIDNVRGGGFIRDGLLAIGDDDKIVFFDGTPKPLRWITDRTRDTAADFRMIAPYIKGEELFVEVNEIYSGTGASFTTVRYKERYDWDLDAWQPSSLRVTLTGTGVKTLNAFRLPVSEQTGRLACYADGKWYSQFQPRPDQNLYNLRGGAVNFDSPATAVSPGLVFPSPVTYAPKKVTGVHLGGDPTGGAASINTPGALKLEIVEYGAAAGTGVSFVWDSDVSNAGRYKPDPTNDTWLMFPQLLWTMTQGSDAALTPQFLPVKIDWEFQLPKREASLVSGGW